MKTGDRFEIPHEGETWTIIRSAIHDGPPFIADAEIAAGKGPPTHFHPHEDEVLEVFEGSVILKLPGRTVTIRAGESVAIPKGTPHSFKAGPDGLRGRSTYDGVHFEGLVAQLMPGDKAGFIRMVLHARRTGWAGSRIANPVLRGLVTTIAGVGWLFGVRPKR
jgi:hypothetical protein